MRPASPAWERATARAHRPRRRFLPESSQVGLLGEGGKLRGVIQAHIQQALNAWPSVCRKTPGRFLGKTDAVDLHWSSSSSAKRAGCASTAVCRIRRQPLRRIPVGVAANMNHDVAALREHAADEQAAMAVSRVLLAANQGHAESLHAVSSRAIPPGSGVVAQTAIKNAAFGVVVGRIGRPSAEFRPRKRYRTPDSSSDRCISSYRTADVLRVGRTARIDHYLNLVLAE